MRFSRLLPVLATLGVLGSACGDAASVVESDHTEGGFVLENSPFMWNMTSYEDFTKTMAPYGLDTEAPPLADDHALTKRLQIWADRIDATVRSEVLRRTGKELVAPKPIVRVIPASSTFNAWVSPVMTCLGSPVVEGSATPVSTPDAGTPGDGGTEAGPDAGGSPVPIPSPIGKAFLKSTSAMSVSTYDACLPAPASWSKEGYASFWNRTKPECTLEFTASGIDVKGAACSGQAQSASDIGIFATSPYIHFATDLVQHLDERTVAVVMAHELAHYYRGHVSPSVKSQFRFWYESTGTAERKNLSPALSLDLEKAYREVTEGHAPVASTVLSERFSRRTVRFLLNFAARYFADTYEANPTCAKASELFTQSAWRFNIADQATPSADDLKGYQAFEDEFDACSTGTFIGLTSNRNNVSVEFLKTIATESKLTGVTVAYGSNLYKFMREVDAGHRARDKKEAEFLRRVKENGVGFYTTEQEADDVALDLSTKIGITPEQVLEGWLDFMRAIDKVGGSSGINASQCEAMLKSGFAEVDANGRSVASFVSIGDLHGNHHATCYRLYNLWREAKTHKYATVSAPSELTPAWSELKAQAAELSK
jgi:hypothetical protein